MTWGLVQEKVAAVGLREVNKIVSEKNGFRRDTWVAQSVKHLPSAQVMISGSWDGALHQAPCSVGSLILLLPLQLPLFMLPFSLSLSLSLSLK